MEMHSSPEVQGHYNAAVERRAAWDLMLIAVPMDR